MFCKNCGAQIADDEIFCNKCGTRQDQSPMQSVNTEPSYTAPASDVPANNAFQNTGVAPVSNNNVKAIWLVAIILQLVAVLLFSFADSVKVTGSVTMKASHSTYGELLNEENSLEKSGSLIEAGDFDDTNKPEILEGYEVDQGGFKTTKILAIVGLVVSGVGVACIAVAAFGKSGKSNLLGAIGIITQIEFIVGSLIAALVVFKNAFLDLMNSGMGYMLDMLRAQVDSSYKISAPMDINVGLTTVGWVAVALGAVAVVVTVMAIKMSKSDKQNNTPVPMTY